MFFNRLGATPEHGRMNAALYRKKAPGVSAPGASKGIGDCPAGYTLNELPHPQVLLTLGLLNLNPDPSIVSM
jgi:hypothetical protein